jgi:hypothetical protein
MKDLISVVLDSESLVAKGDYLRDALIMREYAAYAALIIMILPSLRELHIADFNCASLDHLHNILKNLDSGSDWNRRHASDALLSRLSSIKTVSFNVDKSSGVAYPRHNSRMSAEPTLNLPNITKLCFSIPEGHDARAARPRPGGTIPGGNSFQSRYFNIRDSQMANITSLEIRHSDSALRTLQPLLSTAPHLRSFTYDFFYDCAERADMPPPVLNLSAWSDALPKTLTTLVLALEDCDTSAFPFKQPRLAEKLFGYLDLTRLSALEALEVPFPFLTGDAAFSITADIYPLLPPRLRHLSLRTDMSHAQHTFAYDTSLLPQNLTFQESEDEARHLVNARMDVSYMFHAAMVILDFAKELKTISVWQPPDASLAWFDGQVADFAQTCRNKSITGHLVYPMVLRWKKAEHWNLVRQVTVYDPKYPGTKKHEELCRGERDGIPLGLASQYHLHALRNHQVRLR